MNPINESQLTDIARNLYASSKLRIAAFDVVNGLKQLDFVTPDTSLKGKHRVDALAELGIESNIGAVNQHEFGPFDLYFEGKTLPVQDAKGSIFTDEVDGSLNMERKTGNPNFIFAYTRKTGIDITLRDIEFAFVKSYLTGDEYSAFKGHGAKFVDARTGQTVPLKSDGPQSLKEAVAYLRTGYGKAEEEIVGTYPIFLVVKDIRAFDNTGMELCEIARNAAHIMVENRGISDTQNLLPYLIVKEAGAELTDLHGIDVGDVGITKNRPFDFIAASNPALVNAAVRLLAQYSVSGLEQQLQKYTDEVKRTLKL